MEALRADPYVAVAVQDDGQCHRLGRVDHANGHGQGVRSRVEAGELLGRNEARVESADFPAGRVDDQLAVIVADLDLLMGQVAADVQEMTTDAKVADT